MSGRRAKDGTLRRNFQGYTVDPAPGADRARAPPPSRVSRRDYAQNISGTGDYTKSIREGRFATGRGHVFAGRGSRSAPG